MMNRREIINELQHIVACLSVPSGAQCVPEAVQRAKGLIREVESWPDKNGVALADLPLSRSTEYILRKTINQIHGKLAAIHLEIPDTKMGFAPGIGAILNAYHEADVTLEDAQRIILEITAPQPQEAPQQPAPRMRAQMPDAPPAPAEAPQQPADPAQTPFVTAQCRVQDHAGCPWPLTLQHVCDCACHAPQQPVALPWDDTSHKIERHVETPDELLELLASVSSDPQVEGLKLAEKASAMALLHIAKALERIAFNMDSFHDCD